MRPGMHAGAHRAIWRRGVHDKAAERAAVGGLHRHWGALAARARRAAAAASAPRSAGCKNICLLSLQISDDVACG